MSDGDKISAAEVSLRAFALLAFAAGALHSDIRQPTQGFGVAATKSEPHFLVEFASLSSSLSDLSLLAARDKVGQVILSAFGALADEQLPHD